MLFIKGISQRSINLTNSGNRVMQTVVPADICPTYKFYSYNLDDIYLVESDDFNGSSLDLTKWINGYPWGSYYGVEFWADPNQISFTGNSMKLACNYQPNTFVEANGNTVLKNYGIGAISSIEKYGYGYYEVRCKIPTIVKTHPAFWLFGDCSQEIDVFEFTGLDYIASTSDPLNPSFPDALSTCVPHKNSWFIPQECAGANPIMSTHSQIYPCVGGQQWHTGRTLKYSDWDVEHTVLNTSVGCQYTQTVDVDFHNDWHTFGVKYTPTWIGWYIDGVLKSSEQKYYVKIGGVYLPMSPNNINYYCSHNDGTQLYEQLNFPADIQKMNVILDNARDPATWFNGYNLYDYILNWYDWPEGFLEIDYFKVYHFTECEKDLEFCSNSELDLYYNSVKAKNITFKSNCTINSPNNLSKKLEVKALEEIKILSEFSMDNTCEFSAEIKNCIDGVIQRVSNSNTDSLTSMEYHADYASSKKDKPKLAETISFKNFIVYPSPSNGTFIIKTANEYEKQLNVINNIGISVYKTNFKTEDINLNLNLISGVYFIEITIDGIKSQQKIIIEH
jgi:hypothetical protein